MSDSDFTKALIFAAVSTGRMDDALLDLGRATGALSPVAAPPTRVVVRKEGVPDVHTTARLVSSKIEGAARWETWEVDIEGNPRFHCYDDRRSQWTAKGYSFGGIPQGYVYAKGESK